MLKTASPSFGALKRFASVVAGKEGAVHAERGIFVKNKTMKRKGEELSRIPENKS